MQTPPTKASDLILLLQKAVAKVGDLEVVVVAPHAGVVDAPIEVCTHEDYLDDGAIWSLKEARGPEPCIGRICLDLMG